MSCLVLHAATSRLVIGSSTTCSQRKNKERPDEQAKCHGEVVSMLAVPDDPGQRRGAFGVRVIQDTRVSEMSVRPNNLSSRNQCQVRARWLPSAESWIIS